MLSSRASPVKTVNSGRSTSAIDLQAANRARQHHFSTLKLVEIVLSMFIVIEAFLKLPDVDKRRLIQAITCYVIFQQSYALRENG